MKTQTKTTSKKAILPHADIDRYLARWLVSDYNSYEVKYGVDICSPKLAEIAWRAYNTLVLTPYRTRYRNRRHKPDLPIANIRKLFLAWLRVCKMPNSSNEAHRGSFISFYSDLLWVFWMAAHRNLFRRF